MITLKGTLTDAGGNYIPRGLIELVAKRNAGEALVHAAITERADAEGRYQFNLKSGEYFVYAQVSRQSDVEPLGEAIISSSLGDEMTLEEVLSMSEPLPPESIIEMRQVLLDIRKAESHTSELAKRVAESAETTTTLSHQVNEKSRQVSHQHDEVLQLAQDVLPKLEAANELSQTVIAAAEAVEEQAQSTSSMHHDVSVWYPDIKGKHSAVIEAKKSVDQSKSSIVGLERSVAELSSTALQAAQTATQKAEQTEQDALTTSQDKAAVSELAQQVSSTAQVVSKNQQLTQQAAQAATQKAEQTNKDALSASQNKSEVLTTKAHIDEQANYVAQKTQLVQQLSQEVDKKAHIATEQATIATEQARRAEDLVGAAIGGSLLKDANLSDLKSKSEARDHLDVYSTQQVDNQLNAKVDALALTFNSSAFVYENGRLKKQTIKHGDGEEVISYDYENEMLTKSVSVRNGVISTTLYTYDNGQLVSIGVTKA